MTDRIPPHLIQHTARSRHLAKLRAYYNGDQDAGKPDFWTGQCGNGEIKPVRERAPCINYRFAKSAVQEAVKFTVGEGRFPRIKVEKDEEVYPGVALSAEEAKTLSTFIASLVKQAQIQPLWADALSDGLSTGTAVEIVSIRDGYFHSESAQAEHCDPVFDSVGNVVSMTQCYQTNIENVEHDTIVTKRMFYRRDIDAQYDTVYKLVEVGNGGKPEWTIDTQTQHGFGFCPVNWGRHNRRLGCAETDGESIFDGSLEELDALNLALSHRHRGINYWGNPQPWETGIEDDEQVAAIGRKAKPESKRQSALDPYGGPATGAARKSGVTEVWRSRNADAKFGLFETTGKAFEAASKHVDDIRGRLAEEMSVVLPDLSVIVGKGDISARLLTMLYAPLLGLVDKIRTCWWAGFFMQSLSLRLRMIAVLGGEGIFVPGAVEVGAILRKLIIDGRWFAPSMTPIWGAYFSPSSAETGASVKAAKDANEAGLISKRTAAEYVAQDFGVQDVDEELAAAEEEAQERAEQTAEVMAENGATEEKPIATPDAGQGDVKP